MVEGQTWARFTDDGEFITSVIEETVALNPHLTTSQLKERIAMGRNDPTKIKAVNLRRLGIKALPETFGHLKISGRLVLSFNNLTSLPESIGSMKVGGALDLRSNKLASLPESMGSMMVGGDLDLQGNALISLPASLGSIQVGGDLNLQDNALTSLPESMGSVKMAENMHMEDNKPSYPKPTNAKFPNVKGLVCINL